jgi:predicted transcriptional regulator
MTTEPTYSRVSYNPDQQIIDTQFLNNIGNYNTEMVLLSDKTNKLINIYNQKIISNNSWYMAEIAISIVGSTISGGMGIAKQSAENIAIPISISALMVTTSTGIRQAFLSKTISDDIAIINKYRGRIEAYESRFKAILNKYLAITDVGDRSKLNQSLLELVNDITSDLNI